MFDPSVVGVRYAIVGGVATSAYMPERTTLDIDILMSAQHIDQARSNLTRSGWTKGTRLTPEPGLGLEGESWRLGDRQLDLLCGDADWISAAVAEAQGRERNIIDLPYLVMMKMNAARGVDQGDLTRMLGFATDEVLERTRDTLRRYRPDLLEDLDQYVAIGKLEVEGHAER
jgi:hypothetical protein